MKTHPNKFPPQSPIIQVELDTAFIDAGMDSLSGVSLVSMLNRDFETALTPSVAPWFLGKDIWSEGGVLG